MCPIGGAFFDGFSRGLTSHLVCHCLLIETNQGLVLVDTGFGLRDIQSPYNRLSPFFIAFNNIQFDRQYSAIDQITQLGFSPQDVRHKSNPGNFTRQMANLGLGLKQLES